MMPPSPGGIQPPTLFVQMELCVYVAGGVSLVGLFLWVPGELSIFAYLWLTP